MKKFVFQHFEFSDYLEAIKYFKESVASHGDKIVLVVSYQPYASGYWVEKDGLPLSKNDKVYRMNTLFELEKLLKIKI